MPNVCGITMSRSTALPICLKPRLSRPAKPRPESCRTKIGEESNSCFYTVRLCRRLRPLRRRAHTRRGLFRRGGTAVSEQLVARGRVGAWGISGIGSASAILEDDSRDQPRSRPGVADLLGRPRSKVSVKAPGLDRSNSCSSLVMRRPTLPVVQNTVTANSFRPRCAAYAVRRLEIVTSRPPWISHSFAGTRHVALPRSRRIAGHLVAVFRDRADPAES